MKLADVERHLRRHGCVLDREGAGDEVLRLTVPSGGAPRIQLQLLGHLPRKHFGIA